MEQAPWWNTVLWPLQQCVPRGGLRASFFDWLLGSGVEHLLVCCTLGAGGGGHQSRLLRGKWTIGSTRWFSCTLPWLVRAMNSGLGLWETGQLTRLLAGFSRGISLLPSLHALPTVDSSLSSFLLFFPLVLVSCLLNRFELLNAPSMAHFLPFPKDPGHHMLCLPASYVCFSTSVPSFRTLSPPFLRDQQHQEVLRWEQPTVCGVFVQGGVGVAWLAGQGRAEAQAPVLVWPCPSHTYPFSSAHAPLPSPGGGRGCKANPTAVGAVCPRLFSDLRYRRQNSTWDWQCSRGGRAGPAF